MNLQHCIIFIMSSGMGEWRYSWYFLIRTATLLPGSGLYASNYGIMRVKPVPDMKKQVKRR